MRARRRRWPTAATGVVAACSLREMLVINPQQQSSQPALEPAIPDDFARVSEPLDDRIDRKLGYAGGERFVSYCYEPRYVAVAWNDGRASGHGTGGWWT